MTLARWSPHCSSFTQDFFLLYSIESSHLSSKANLRSEKRAHKDVALDEPLRRCACHLFVPGAWTSTRPDAKKSLERIGAVFLCCRQIE